MAPVASRRALPALVAVALAAPSGARAEALPVELVGCDHLDEAEVRAQLALEAQTEALQPPGPVRLECDGLVVDVVVEGLARARIDLSRAVRQARERTLALAVSELLSSAGPAEAPALAPPAERGSAPPPPAPPADARPAPLRTHHLALVLSGGAAMLGERPAWLGGAAVGFEHFPHDNLGWGLVVRSLFGRAEGSSAAADVVVLEGTLSARARWATRRFRLTLGLGLLAALVRMSGSPNAPSEIGSSALGPMLGPAVDVRPAVLVLRNLFLELALSAGWVTFGLAGMRDDDQQIFSTTGLRLGIELGLGLCGSLSGR